MDEPLRRCEVSILSPLRYPGAKRRLSGYVAETLRLNGIRPRLLVEPFAGGASVAIELLSRDLVDSIALGERDPLVSSFWKVVFKDPAWLIKQVETVEVTLAMWDHFRGGRFRSNRDRALACLFLNRTSFSGILAERAGPLGGRTQASAYKIGCRFPIKTLTRRIEQAAAMRNRVLFVNGADWKETLRRVSGLGYSHSDVFYYFDPPFYAKADRLYRFFFSDDDHHELHDRVTRLRSPWLLSYDPAPFILDLYSRNGRKPQDLHLLYSAASGPTLVPSREVIITNRLKLPKETRLWRTNGEW
jgi:DNA adenine methylase